MSPLEARAAEVARIVSADRRRLREVMSGDVGAWKVISNNAAAFMSPHISVSGTGINAIGLSRTLEAVLTAVPHPLTDSQLHRWACTLDSEDGLGLIGGMLFSTSLVRTWACVATRLLGIESVRVSDSHRCALFEGPGWRSIVMSVNFPAEPCHAQLISAFGGAS